MVGERKIEGIFDEKPFYKQYYFVGSVESKNGEKLSNLNIYIEFKASEPSKIMGIVLGNPIETFKQLDNMLVMGEYCTLKSDRNTNSYYKIYSDKLLISEISKDSSNASCQVVATFSLKEVKITSKTNCDKTHIRIYYEGMESFRVYSRFKYVWDGTVEKNKRKKREYFQNLKNADIDFEDYYFFENKNKIRTSRFARTILFTINKTTYKPEDIDSVYIKFLNEVLLIASFVENNDNQWFAYELFNGKEKLFYYRSSKRKPVISDQDNFLIGANNIEKFVSNALPKYKELKKDGIDLKAPIDYLLTASAAPNLDVAYINYFTALEKIKDMYAMSKNPTIDFVCDKEKQQEITDEILPTLKTKLGSDYDENSYKQKLKVVYRNSFLKLLKELNKEYSIEIKDLYPKGKANLRTIIEVRDDLIHSSIDIDSEKLILNLYRLKAITQRIIIRMLGWTHQYEIPDPFVQKTLQNDKIEFI
ncbi:hypothetical protein KKF86_07040 [bacterium]|nr:hypothetical protein [bacterium]